MPNLFSYGTLQLEKVQLESFGRVLQGKEDVLSGYKIEQVEITDPVVLAKSEQKYHPILVEGQSSDTVCGTVFKISEEELAQADLYEVDDYKRIAVELFSRTKAFVYVKNKG